MEEKNKTSKEKKEITKKRSEKKISPIVPLAVMSGLLVGTIGSYWMSVLFALLVGSLIGFIVCNWVWIGRQHK